MKITTLRTGTLTLSAVEYKFNADGYLSVKLTDADHKLYGDVNITLANVVAINIYDLNGTLVEDFFNDTFLFTRSSSDELVYTQRIKSGVPQSESFLALADDGDDITATIANSSFDLPAGTYNFNLLDTADSEFSTSTIAIKQLNIGGTGVDGLESIFNEEGTGDSISINGQDLTFYSTARVSIEDNDAGVTNIPLVIY